MYFRPHPVRLFQASGGETVHHLYGPLMLNPLLSTLKGYSVANVAIKFEIHGVQGLYTRDRHERSISHIQSGPTIPGATSHSLFALTPS